jgi:hypothetical protein
MWSRTDEIAHHQRRYRRGELETKLRRNGFEILFSTSFTAALLPLMIMSRFRRSGEAGGEAIDREFALNPRVNGLFAAILRAEVRLTLAGFKWPAGGSRVVVGRAV